MRTVSLCGAAALILGLSACAPAVESGPAPDSGVAVGGKIGTYKATKAGGVDDGVEAGKSLCFT
jgi:hypothetical protein